MFIIPKKLPPLFILPIKFPRSQALEPVSLGPPPRFSTAKEKIKYTSPNPKAIQYYTIPLRQLNLYRPQLIQGFCWCTKISPIV